MVRRLLIWSVKDIVECIEKMTSKDVKFDCILFIEGSRGLGKSTLAYKILSHLTIELPFKPKRDIVYSREDTLKHLANKINGCILSDEMINVAYKRDFYEQEQKELLRAFDMYRDSRNVFVGCIPKFADLDSKLQMLCKIRITVIRRGFALIQLKNNQIFTTDPWDIRYNQKIESKWSASHTRNPRYSQLTTVRGCLRFGDLSHNQRIEYDEIKTNKRNQIFAKYEQFELAKDPQEVMLENTINLLKQNQITKDKFELICKINNLEPDKFKRIINKKLKDIKDPKTWKDYCFTEFKKVQRDKLGFVLRTAPNPPNITQAQPVAPLTIKESTEENDVLGFES